MGTYLVLQKLFSRSSFYDITCFSIHASAPHLDATITSEYIFWSSSIDTVMFNCGTLEHNSINTGYLHCFRGLFQ